jgi:hypothetical protein
MALNRDSFITKLASLQSLLPFGKTLPPEAFVLAWESFPAQAKEELTDAAITWAMTKLLNDPEQHKELPIHMRLHRMLYRYANLSTSSLTIGPVPMGWRLKVDPYRLPPVDAPPPVSEAALVAAGELPAYDGPRHAPGGVLAQLQQGRP